MGKLSAVVNNGHQRHRAGASQRRDAASTLSPKPHIRAPKGVPRLTSLEKDNRPQSSKKIPALKARMPRTGMNRNSLRSLTPLHLLSAATRRDLRSAPGRLVAQVSPVNFFALSGFFRTAPRLSVPLLPSALSPAGNSPLPLLCLSRRTGLP